MSIPEIPTDKIVMIRFDGGPRDGQQLCSDNPSQRQEFVNYWRSTEGGTFRGASFEVSPAYEMARVVADISNQRPLKPSQRYIYQVVDKKETDEEIKIEIKCFGSRNIDM
jgi:hypothetical protein